jgi:metallo-beta-lactamase class B
VLIDGALPQSAPLIDPSIVESFRRSIASIAGLPCDVLLSTHPGFVGIDEKLSRRQKGEAESFLDDKACRAYAEAGTKALDARIAEEN